MYEEFEYRAPVDKWVLNVARDMATELEVPIGSILMDADYDGRIGRTCWQNVESPMPYLMAFSRPFWQANMGDDEFLTDIVLHEMAHAILPAGHGHDGVWEDLARSLGSNAEQYAVGRGKQPTDLRYQGKCYKCGWRISTSVDMPGNVYFCAAGTCTGKYRVVDTQKG